MDLKNIERRVDQCFKCVSTVVKYNKQLKNVRKIKIPIKSLHTCIKSIPQEPSWRSHFGNRGAEVEWLYLGSLQTPQEQRSPPGAPGELHCIGAIDTSM